MKKAAAILQQSKLAIRFHGFVEGDDIAMGTVDVIVTDGFTGNIALKTAEGTARLYTHLLKQRAGQLAAGAAGRPARRTGAAGDAGARRSARSTTARCSSA